MDITLEQVPGGADFRFVNGRCHSVLTVNAIIGIQAFQNGRCYICFNLGLDKVETGYFVDGVKMLSPNA